MSGSEPAPTPVEYVPVAANSFLNETKAVFDIFLKMAQGHYVKICPAGTVLDKERVTNYIAKGIIHFYIRKDDQHEHLLQVEATTTRIIESAKVPMPVKLTQVMQFGQETVGFIRTLNLSGREIKAALDFVHAVERVFQQFQAETQNVLLALVKELSGYDHEVGTTMIASLISKNLDIGTMGGAEILGIASLFHDIGLLDMPFEVQDEDETNLNLANKATYRKHPELGSEVLRHLPGVNVSVVQAVAHHHVRRNQAGFPVEFDYNNTSMFARILGISSEFSRRILRKRLDPASDPLALMDQEVYVNFSQEIVGAFKKTFGVPR